MNRAQFFNRSIFATLSSRVSGAIISMSRLLAHCLTGDCVSFMPRPFFWSGVVTTRVGRYPASSSASKTTVANSGVPKNANLTSLFFIGFLVIHFCRFVGVKNSLQMVKLVLKDVGEESRRSARELRAVFIIRAHSRLFRARHDAPFTADREAPLMLGAFPAGHFHEFWIYVHLIWLWWLFQLTLGLLNWFIRSIALASRERTPGNYKKSQWLADLRGGERNAVFLFSKKTFHFCYK